MKFKRFQILNNVILLLLGIILINFSILQIGFSKKIEKNKSLRLSVKLYKQEDVEFYNRVLDENDIIATYGVKPWLLSNIKGPKIMVTRGSLSAIKKELKRAEKFAIHIDYLSYNPEQWKETHTPRKEIDNLLEAVKKARKLAEQINAKLSFATDNILLEQYGGKIAPLVDLFIVQMQRYQREPIEEFRQEAIEKFNIIRKGNKKVPIFFQLSLSPPKWKIITKPDGTKKRVHMRTKEGKKLLEPLKAEVVLRQIEAIKDLADGIALIYTEESRDEVKKLLLLLKQ
jgi:hypothetical protein